MTNVLAKKLESLATTKEIMDSLKGMFGQPEWSLRHKAIKYIYTKHMKEGTSVREHVLDMMMHFNIAEVNGGAINEANHVSFILESLSKSFIPFQTNASLNKIECNLTTLLNELLRLKNLTKAGPSKSNKNIEKKGNGKTPKQNKDKKTAEKGKITLKVGTGEMVSAKAVEDLKIGRLVKSGLLSRLEYNSLPPCDFCLERKMTKRSFTGKDLRAKTPLKLVHSDLSEPMNVKARGGYEYFISFIDDYSTYGHVYLIQNKSGSFEKLKEYKAEVENETGKIIKTFPSDRCGEYMELRFEDYLIEHGTQSQLSTPSTPQQNGVSERRN
ncbi:gag/pol protein [Cucumis melo var. makuwa]|uniref:Gag/pol protein n=1 Tax=Cucumis melo var. makuwa TaxID=1194695 RepID=A0A5A7V3M2_CUCMM|nr:gag/pol protein [Cucumis melo var. makuwa]